MNLLIVLGTFLTASYGSTYVTNCAQIAFIASARGRVTFFQSCIFALGPTLIVYGLLG